MKLSAIAPSSASSSPARTLAAPGPTDPRLIQGTLEWPPALSGGETFIVVRGGDGRVYYADVMAAQRHVHGALNAGSHITLLGHHLGPAVLIAKERREIARKAAQARWKKSR